MCFSQVLEEAGARTSGETGALVSVGVLILSQALAFPGILPPQRQTPGVEGMPPQVGGEAGDPPHYNA